MRRVAIAVLLSSLASAQSHQHMKVMYDDAVWQPEQLKSCVMPTSRTLSRRGEPSAKQNKLFCSTSGKYSRMTVSLDSAAENAFDKTNKWGNLSTAPGLTRSMSAACMQASNHSLLLIIRMMPVIVERQ